MDAVVLAAGNGERLAGVMPTGMKPLLVVNGESMIVHVTKRIAEGEPRNIIYVVSPVNVAPIIDVLRAGVPDLWDRMMFIVQPDPTGPVDALFLGSHMIGDELVCVACADNIIDEGLVARMRRYMEHSSDRQVLIPVVKIPEEDIGRYTPVYRWPGDDYHWTGDDYHFHSGARHAEDEYEGAWIGPLVFRTSYLTDGLMAGFTTFAELLGALRKQMTIESHCVDVGVPL